MLRILHTLGWLLCAAYSTIPGYWLLIHPRVNYWRAQQRSPYRVILPVWGVMVAAVLGITARFRAMTLYQSGWAWLPAVVLFAVGIWLYKMGGANFSLKQLQGQPEISGQKEEQQLVTSGIRARVRHPVYLAHFCEMLAWSIGTGLVVCYSLTGLTILTDVFMIRAEDAELEQRFGEDYRRYRNTVPAVLPKLGDTVSRL